MEVAKGAFPRTAKSGLGNLAVEHGQDLLVGYIAHLVVLIHDLAVLVADTAVAGLHEGITSIILGTNVAVDTRPSIVTVA